MNVVNPDFMLHVHDSYNLPVHRLNSVRYRKKVILSMGTYLLNSLPENQKSSNQYIT